MPEEPSEEDGARAEFEAMAERLRETVARRKAARVGIHRFRVISGKSVADAAGSTSPARGWSPRRFVRTTRAICPAVRRHRSIRDCSAFGISRPTSCRTRSGIHREAGAKPLGGPRNKSGVTMDVLRACGRTSPLGLSASECDRCGSAHLFGRGGLHADPGHLSPGRLGTCLFRSHSRTWPLLHGGCRNKPVLSLSKGPA
jgi:hypothetical protein